LLIVQPLRGMNALNSEIQLNTMDLIQLTRLDGWRLTLGKWTALNAQTLLLVTGVLPYLVIRYFLGNVNFVRDLVDLLMLTLGSGLASAIAIGCSVFRNLLLRGVILIGFGMGLTTLFAALKGSGFRTGSDFWMLGLVCISLLYGCFFFLSFGASRISPLSENLATRKRLVALGLTLVAAGFAISGFTQEVLIISGLILGFAVIDALTEPLPIYARVLEPFRKNPMTRLAALFLAPGWMSGIGFFFFCSLVWGAILYAGGFFAPATPGSWQFEMEKMTFYLSMCNLLIFPLIFIHLFFGRQASVNFTFGFYAFIQACLLVLTIMATVLANAIPQYEDLIFVAVPIPSVLISGLADGEADELVHLLIALATTLLAVTIPLVRHQKDLREFRHHLKSS
ncbi:MAG: hypothetical protein ABL994_19595, partial [Verrucomicrobiales bacterium]